MGDLDAVRRELDYLRDNYKESFTLRGFDVSYYPPVHVIKDVNRDVTVTYRDPIFIRVNFEDHPRPLLKKMHWLEEDEENQYVVFLPYYIQDRDPLPVERYAVVEFRVHPLSSEDHRFIINQIRGSGPDPLIWLAKVSPYRDELVIHTEVDNNRPTVIENSEHVGNVYLKRNPHSAPDLSGSRIPKIPSHPAMK